jgi:hypothetical protein
MSIGFPTKVLLSLYITRYRVGEEMESNLDEVKASLNAIQEQLAGTETKEK